MTLGAPAARHPGDSKRASSARPVPAPLVCLRHVPPNPGLPLETFLLVVAENSGRLNS